MKHKFISVVILLVVALGWLGFANYLVRNDSDDGDLSNTDKGEAVKCQPEQRDVDACIEIYQPVCGLVNVQCITTPCDPVEETFSNFCFACQNSLVESYTVGECQ